MQQLILWGVMFSDGSVCSRWNGRTQQQRATEYAQRCAADWTRDNITLAYRKNHDSSWVRVPLDQQEEPCHTEAT